jgi:hypothetical protein
MDPEYRYGHSSSFQSSATFSFFFSREYFGAIEKITLPFKVKIMLFSSREEQGPNPPHPRCSIGPNNELLQVPSSRGRDSIHGGGSIAVHSGHFDSVWQLHNR